MVYVANMFSGTVSAINGTTNNVTAVVRINIHPSNSGYIECNHKILQQNFTRYDVGTKIVCKATAYNGFEFSSWSGDLAPYTLLNESSNMKSNATIGLEVLKYGTLDANFVSSTPVSIPTEFWAPLYGIIPAVIASTFIPSILQRNKEKRESKRHREYYNDQIGKLEIDELEKEVTQLYREGKINESDYLVLKDEIKNYKNKSGGT
jgi:YVTN family beta-propeller protein